MSDRQTLEDALMRIVERGAGRFGWHDIGVQLSMLNVPRRPDMLQTLRGLARRGLIVESRESTRDRWALSDAGRYFLARGGHQKTDVPTQLRPLVGTLEGDLAARVQGLAEYVNEPSALVSQLRRLAELDLGPHDGIAFAASVIAEPARSDLLVELGRSEHLAMRAAVFRLWAPIRMLRPGQRPMQLDTARWDRLLRAGLMDADSEIRQMAAGLAFDTGRGAALCRELLANVHSRDPGLRRSAILALGGAQDAPSLAALRRILAHGQPDEAGVALRALAARKDGRTHFWVAFDDERSEVREAAVHVLRWAVAELGDTRLQALGAREDTAIDAALSSYRARQQETT